MAKDLMFKLRLDEQDRARLDKVAAHFSAPAATAVRILIKEKFDQIEAADHARASTRVDDLDQMSFDILGAIDEKDPRTASDIAEILSREGYDAKTRGLGTRLNELRARGLIRRLATGYVLTAKGKAIP